MSDDGNPHGLKPAEAAGGNVDKTGAPPIKFASAQEELDHEELGRALVCLRVRPYPWRAIVRYSF